MRGGEGELGVSIVVAVDAGPSSLAECLRAIAEQRDDRIQVLGVCNRPQGRQVVERFPWVEWQEAGPSSLVPDLWAQGILASRHEVVVTTTARFVPQPGWMRHIRSAHRDLKIAAVGGMVEPPAAGGAAMWAAYYLRYSRLRRLPPGRRGDLVADNASYRRRDLQEWEGNLHEGFWEPDFHRYLASRDEVLVYEPQIKVRLAASFGVGRFCVRRFIHGHRFGRWRVADVSRWERLARLITSPLIPAVLVARTYRNVASREALRFALALPALVLFASCWSLGEALGYLEASLGWQLTGSKARG